MTRWTFRIMICLLLGVVTTVGVAWGLAATSNLRVSSMDDNFLGYSASRIESGSMRTLLANDAPGSLLVLSLLELESSGGDIFEEVTIRLEIDGWLVFVVPRWAACAKCAPGPGSVVSASFAGGYGWPCLSLCGVVHDPIHNGVFGANNPIQVDGLSAIVFGARPFTTSPPRLLPVRAIFPGFLINTAFYAALWFTLITGWLWHMRLIRSWQGYCPMCKYDLRAEMEQGCSECGWNRDP